MRVRSHWPLQGQSRGDRRERVEVLVRERTSLVNKWENVVVGGGNGPAPSLVMPSGEAGGWPGSED